MARRELGPGTLAVVQAVRAALTPADRTLLVACSGGPDSLALAYAVRHQAERRGLPYAAAVVDHGLQNGSDRIAAAAHDQLTALGYDRVEVLRVQVDPDHPDGPEAAARESRYAALADRAAGDAATVLLGHTLDDQAETVLLGLARGSGTRSLSGMAVRRDALLRPLLGVRRATTVASCAELGLTPWIDPHNADPRYARARVRADVLPVLEDQLGPGVAEALARTAELLRDDAVVLDSLAAAVDTAGSSLEVAALTGLPTAVRRRVLISWLSGHGITGLGSVHVRGVDRLITDWHGQRRAEVPGGSVTRVNDRLFL